MKVIDKVEIKYFRSFLGTPQIYSTELSSLVDINIFSGANDSGKSNVLRALNLFFNDEISSNNPLLFERDFFVGTIERVQKVIEIGVSFDLSSDKKDDFLPEKFKITKFYDRNGYRNSLYTFRIKEIDQEIRVDSRVGKYNDHVASLFLSDKSTKDEIKRAQKRELNYRIKFAGFLNKTVSYEYVPAIRDSSFFSHLFGRVIAQIKKREDERLENLLKEKNKIINWTKTIKNKKEKPTFKTNLASSEWRANRILEIEGSEKRESKVTAAINRLETEINQYSSGLINSIKFLPAEFKVGKDLREFFENFEVGTGSDKAISLNLRGDGIQAKFVPKILDFLSHIDTNKYFLWGLEEPENSAEYRNQQELANELKNGFSQSKQIFLTTHSEEFLQLYDGVEVPDDKRRANLYHVKKMKNKADEEYSRIYLFDVDKNEFEFANQKSELDNDLGQSLLRAKYSKELKSKEDEFLSEKKRIEHENTVLRVEIQQNNKPVVFVEDRYTQIYKIAWLKLRNKTHNENNFERQFDNSAHFAIHSTEGAGKLAGLMRASNLDYMNGKKIVGVFDFDDEGVQQFKHLKDQDYWKANPLKGSKKEGFYRQRKDYPGVYAMLLPVPDELKTFADLEHSSYVEVESLLPKEFLATNAFVKEREIAGGVRISEVKIGAKPNIWKKTFALDAEGFVAFRPLYDTIDLLIK